MKYSRKQEGFEGQKLYVIPPLVGHETSLSLIIRNLQVTDAGYFPSAAGHQKIRRESISEGILLYCAKGSGFVRTGDESWLVHGGQACYLEPGRAHIYGASDHDPWSLYWIHLRGELLSIYTQSVSGTPGPVPVASGTRTQVVQLFEMLFSAMEGGYSRSIQIHTGQLAGSILTSLFHSNRDFHPGLQKENSRRLDRVISLMREAAEGGEALTLGMMADAAGVSVPHFSELFRKGQGCPPVEYFNQLKIQRACRLLELSDLSVRSIASECGYSDPYYFSRLFKKVMGISPREYRSRVLSGPDENLFPS